MRSNIGSIELVDNLNGTAIIGTTQTEPELQMPFLRGYLRASTEDQDAVRARDDLQQFASQRGLNVASWYIENESGATLNRPELFRLINDAHCGDLLLVEQVDRLSRLSESDWEILKSLLSQKRIRVVALDLPTSWGAATGLQMDETTQAMLDAINRMLLDVLAVVARKDYMDRRRRQSQGIAKAKLDGRYKGRRANEERHSIIRTLLDNGLSWSQVSAATKASRSTILRVVNARKSDITSN